MRHGPLCIAMLSIHSSPTGPLGSKNTGGMSVFIRELASELGACGHRVDIFTRRDAPALSDAIALAPGVRLVHLPIGPAHPLPKRGLSSLTGDGVDALETYSAQNRIHYDIVHSHYWISGLMGRAIRDRWQIPHVVTFHTLGRVKNHVLEATAETPERIQAESSLVADSDRLLVPTARERSLLSEHYGAPGGRIGLVPCGVDLDRFKPRGKAASRRHLGLDSDAEILLFVGRFEAMKGLDNLIQAVGQLTRRPGARLIVVGGDGDGATETRKLKSLAATEGIEDRISFVGRQDPSRLPWYYSAADLLVMPSRYESFGMVALEALACGTPVVATRVGAMETVIDGRGNGLLAAENQPTSLARAIDGFWDQERLPSPNAIRETVRAMSWRKAADRLLDEYGRVLERS